MNGYEKILLITALSTGGLSVLAGAFKPRSLAQWSFLVAITLTTCALIAQRASLVAHTTEEMVQWQRVSMVPLAMLPLAWLTFSLTFARGDANRFLRLWRPALLLASALPAFLLIGYWHSIVQQVTWTSAPGNWVFQISSAGKIIFAFQVVASVLIMANLESTFRAAVGTARWKIKHTIIGLAIWCGAQIYSGSQTLLYSQRSVSLMVIEAAAALLACCFFAVATFRSQSARVDVYPSPAVLRNSLVVILAGAYLAVVGLVAKAASLLGGWGGFPVASLVVLAGLSGFGVLCLSDRFRSNTRRFISQHFRRPSHDYRRLWSAVTKRTAKHLNPQEYARHLVGIIADTFETLSVTIWLPDKTNRRFVLAASSAIEVRDAEVTSLDPAIYDELCNAPTEGLKLVDLNRSTEKWSSLLKASTPAWFPEVAQEHFCRPMVFGSDVVGLMVLGDRVGGRPFTIEDIELLDCLSDHMAAGLCTLHLSEKLLKAREMEAFQMMSTFLVHDLKNTASALSLTLTNLPRHFDNPSFREDALRTLSRSVQRVNELIGRLSSLRQNLELKPVPNDLNLLVASARQHVGEMPNCKIQQELPVLPRIPLDAPRIESVIVNLLANAREAFGEKAGEIRIVTGCEGENVFLEITDNGCGMSPEFLAHSLFKPFQTSKKNGLGIGMYQTKTIVEAHGGRITVRSQAGQGTSFKIFLPLHSQSISRSP